jgi:integrase
MVEKREPRARGTGGLIKIAGCRFWYMTYWHNGRQVRESTKSEARMVAERLLHKRLGEKAIGKLPASEVAKLRYEDLRESLLLDYKMNGHKSLSRKKDGGVYLSSLRHLDKFFEGRKVSMITADEIRRFALSRQAANAANGTINRSLAALKRMFKLAMKDGKLQAMPNISMLKEASPRKGFLEFGEFQKLRDNLPERLKPVLTLGYDTGMRLGEIRNLKWEQVNLQEREIRLHAGETKNDEARTIPLNSETVLMLKMLRKKTDSIFVFGNGRPLGSFRKAWRKACIKSGLGKMTKHEDGTEVYEGLIFHDLRRSAVRDYVRGGTSESVAMRISGHKTRSVFERYNIITKTDLKNAAEQKSRYMAEKQNEIERQAESGETVFDENTVKKQAVN